MTLRELLVKNRQIERLEVLTSVNIFGCNMIATLFVCDVTHDGIVVSLDEFRNDGGLCNPIVNLDTEVIKWSITTPYSIKVLV